MHNTKIKKQLCVVQARSFLVGLEEEPCRPPVTVGYASFCVNVFGLQEGHKLAADKRGSK